MIREVINVVLPSAVMCEVRVENIKSPEDHVEAMFERVEKRYIAATYGITDWTSHEDFLEQIAYKSGRLLKVNTEPCCSCYLTVLYADVRYNLRKLGDVIWKSLFANILNKQFEDKHSVDFCSAFAGRCSLKVAMK